MRSPELKEKTRAVRRRKRESSWPFFFPRGKRDHYLPRSPSASRFAGDASNAGAVTRAQLASRTGASRDLASCRMPSAECRVHGGKALCSRTAIEPPSAHTHPICFPPAPYYFPQPVPRKGNEKGIQGGIYKTAPCLGASEIDERAAESSARIRHW